MYSFVRAMTAVSAVIFLISPRWNLATISIFSLFFEASRYSDAAAYIVVMIAIIVVAIGVLDKAVKLLGKPGRAE